MSVRLKFSDRERFRVFSCYAPTFSSPRAAKDEFYQSLQAALAEVEDGEKCIVLGDFNAQVGSRDGGADPWSSVRGPTYGFGSLNSSGREGLNFLSVNSATICNTWFRKRDIHKRTWRHPRSGEWKCFDYIIVAQSHRCLCLDSQVFRSAECNSDHNLLCARFALRKRFYHFPRAGVNRCRFDVAKLSQRQDGREMSAFQMFQQTVRERVEVGCSPGREALCLYLGYGVLCVMR